jgi:membrane-associated phospholipid phosphatase
MSSVGNHDGVARPGLLQPSGVAALAGVALVVTLIALVGWRWGPLYSLDHDGAADLHRYIARHARQLVWWKRVSQVGSPAVFRSAAALVTVGLLLLRRLREALLLVTVTVGAAALSAGVKAAVHRARPILAQPVDHAGGPSFPSGHALTSFVVVCALLLVLTGGYGPAVRVAAAVTGALLILAVGVSRLVLGVHFVSDVLGGWLIGATWLLACHRLACHRILLPARRWVGNADREGTGQHLHVQR